MVGFVLVSALFLTFLLASISPILAFYFLILLAISTPVVAGMTMAYRNKVLQECERINRELDRFKH